MSEGRLCWWLCVLAVHAAAAATAAASAGAPSTWAVLAFDSADPKGVFTAEQLWAVVANVQKLGVADAHIIILSSSGKELMYAQPKTARIPPANFYNFCITDLLYVLTGDNRFGTGKPLADAAVVPSSATRVFLHVGSHGGSPSEIGEFHEQDTDWWRQRNVWTLGAVAKDFPALKPQLATLNANASAFTSVYATGGHVAMQGFNGKCRTQGSFVVRSRLVPGRVAVYVPKYIQSGLASSTTTAPSSSASASSSLAALKKPSASMIKAAAALTGDLYGDDLVWAARVRQRIQPKGQLVIVIRSCFSAAMVHQLLRRLDPPESRGPGETLQDPKAKRNEAARLANQAAVFAAPVVSNTLIITTGQDKASANSSGAIVDILSSLVADEAHPSSARTDTWEAVLRRADKDVHRYGSDADARAYHKRFKQVAHQIGLRPIYASDTSIGQTSYKHYSIHSFGDQTLFKSPVLKFWV